MSETLPLTVVDDPDDAPTEDGGLALPDWQAVQPKPARMHATTESNQVVRQRCGGGFRIIRKQIGGN